MNGAAALVAHGATLRVFVAAEDAARRARLSDLVAGAGHALVALQGDADVVLSDVAGSADEGHIAISLGGDARDSAGLIPRDADPRQIDAALRAVAAGLIVRGPRAAEPGFGALDEGEGQKLLTPREIEVLHAIGEGLTNKAIARRLGISLHTVKFHVEAIFRKLGVRTRTGAIAKASEHRAQAIEL